MHLDQRVLTGVRGLSTSVVTQGCEFNPEGFFLGQTNPSTLASILAQATSTEGDGEGAELVSIEDALDTHFLQKGYTVMQHKKFGIQCTLDTSTFRFTLHM